MKSIFFLISLLLLSTLLHEAQGLKSRKLLTKTSDSTSTSAATSSSKNHQKIEGNTNEAEVNGKFNTSATTTTKQREDHQKREKFSVKSSPVQQEAAPKHYPDVLDIAGMDYSPARRKSPIHN